LLKKKERAQNEKNQQAVADACNKLGNWYIAENQLDEALNEFREAGEIYRRLSLKMDDGRSSRMISEVYIKQGKYQDALKCVKRYLKIAKEEGNQVEIQRAHTTLGRCYLMIAEESSLNGDDITNNEDYKEAEKQFLKGLLACKE
jgi:tetratricopeptide (TPR) repeat protein